jgi:hypothetical protein
MLEHYDITASDTSSRSVKPADSIAADALAMKTESTGRFAIVWLGLVLLLSAWATRTSGNVVDLDLWHELSLARETLRLGAVPRTDLFAYTPTVSPMLDHEWGAGMLAYGALNTAGAAGIVALTLCAFAAACLFSCACARKQNADARIVALAGIVTAPLFAMGFAPVRAQAYSFVFFAALLLAIEMDRQGARWALAAWMPMFVLWVNCHASFVLAFIFLGVYWADALWGRGRNLHILAAMAVCAGLVAVNPYGVAMYPYVWRSVRMARPFVDEWSPAWHGRFAALLRPILISLGLALYAFWHRRGAFLRREAPLQPAATILLAAAAGLMHVKLLPYYAFAFLAYFAAIFGATPVGTGTIAILGANRKAFWVTWAGVIMASIVALGTLQFWALRVPDHGDAVSDYPVGAVEYMAQQRFEGRLMTPFDEGAYVSWKLYPRVRVSMDSRYEVAYPEWMVTRNQLAYDTGEWRSFVGAYPTDAILAHRNSPMEASLSGSWRRVYRDGAYCLFARPGLELAAVDYEERTFDGSLP